jgi:hypothetical protein
MGLEQYDRADESYQRAQEIFLEIGQKNLSMEPLAGLSASLLDRGEPSTSLMHVETILEHLQEYQAPDYKMLDGAGVTSTTSETGAIPGLEGTAEPLWIYLACYEVLIANNDSRAQEILSTAQHFLEDQVAKIEDPDLQYSFLNNVITNREIQSAGKSGGNA